MKTSTLKIVTFRLLFLALLLGASPDAYALESVLSAGKWYPLTVSKSGVYRVDYSDMQALGLDPLKAQVYGYGGKMLSENFALNDYVSDLPPVPVYRHLGADGVFNQGDFILFYAQGPISWSYNSYYAVYARTSNPYSETASYFLGERPEGTLLVTSYAESQAPNRVVRSFTDFILHEKEQVNLAQTITGKGTGRSLFGEDLWSQNPLEVTFEVPNVDTTVVSAVFSEMVVNNPQSTSALLYLNNQYVTSTSFLSISNSDEYRYGYTSSFISKLLFHSDRLTFKINYLGGTKSSKSRAYLDHITLNVRRQLIMTENQMAFRDPLGVATQSVSKFEISNAERPLLVFDVSNPLQTLLMTGETTNQVYSFVNQSNVLKEYVAVDVSKTIPKPKIGGRVSNQNLHGLNDLDLVIVVPKGLHAQAVRLAEAHAQYDGMKTLVVTPEQVYNEFSSGTPDATAIRRMMQYYRNHPNQNGLYPKHLLLFGDGIYDNRWISKALATKSEPANRLFTYQSIESLNELNSFVSDDYFGFLDANEGANLGMAKMDIGVGRFPVSTLEEAQVVVDKTIEYIRNRRKGAWKNKLLFLADNWEVEKDQPYIHEKQSNNLAERVHSKHPELIVNKIFLDTYPPLTSASGTTMPDANARFKQLLNEGVLLVNYTGHGSTEQWTEEKLLMSSEISQMTNKNLPLWITATCDFSRYDEQDKSGGEKILLHENGGGVALVSTTRVVYSDGNYTMNTCFLDSLFAKKGSRKMSLGEVMRTAKSSSDLSGDNNKLRFTLLGDPALKLTYSEFQAEVTEMNGNPVGSQTDTLRALQKVTVKGRVLTPDGAFANTFNGVVIPTVLDASEILAKFDISPGDTFVVSDRNKILFSGRDSVVNGVFEFSFVVPMDNSYSLKNGMINLYAYSSDTDDEASGAFSRFVMGGTVADMERDADGPNVKLYLNNLLFKDGGKVGNKPTFFADIFDENGLNTSGNGIGHNLTLVIDNDPDLTFNLNAYFLADLGSYQSGTVGFQLPQLASGEHRLTFRCWDVQNNSSESSLTFTIQNKVEPVLSDIQYAQKNNLGYFRFIHDRPLSDVKVQLAVFDLYGRKVFEDNWFMKSENTQSELLEWNLTNTKGHRVPNGFYVCRFVFIDSNNVQTEGSKKIIVSEQ